MSRHAFFTAIVTAFVLGGLYSPTARAAAPAVNCTVADKLTLAKAGYTKKEIDAECAPAASPRPSAAQPSAVECPTPSQHGGFVELPHPSTLRPLTQPPYPSGAERRGASGKVVLLLSVDAYGRVTDGKVDTTSGHPDLDFTALNEALSNWRLLPGTVNGKPQAMPVKFTVNFQLPDETK